MPSSVISSFGVKGRAGPKSSSVCRTLVRMCGVPHERQDL
jgi:hypothetical protein